jgi:hypothetical protein
VFLSRDSISQPPTFWECARLAIYDGLANDVARGRRKHRDWRIVRMHMLRRLLMTVLLIVPAISGAETG